ncbi:MAG: alpha-galactosidase [Propionibacteriaceae bacterium]|jgi:alpha-galactosidase|nr:alpha-galactosidase [Propionibacteriaceae bacterium]
MSAPAWQELGRGLRVGTSGSLQIKGVERRGALLVARIAAGAGYIVLEAPLGNAAGFWYPTSRLAPALPADWWGRESFSAIKSAPVGALYDVDKTSGFAFAFDCVVDEGELEFGVSEEGRVFVVRLGVSSRVGPVALAVVADAQPYERAIRQLTGFLAAAQRPVSRAATWPVYSTWYAHSQRVTAEIIEAEARMAVELGCRSVFIDDGWQQHGTGRWYSGCGDWVPDPDKFPDLRATVDRLHGRGLDVVLWVAPLLVGERSEAGAALLAYSPVYVDGLRARVLDPRRPEVRAHVAETCARLVRDYGVDGLKIDFLNNAMVYSGGEESVGRAMVELLREVAGAVGPGTLIEFRQPYVSPAVAEFADVIRAGDCPADADQNRRSIVNLRLFAAGQVVHSDPLMWDAAAGPEAAARQVLGAFFGVPQLSMPLASLPGAHRRVVAELLAEWTALREVILGGTLFAALPAEGYPVVGVRRADELCVAAYEPRQLDLDLAGVTRLAVVNATAETALPYVLRGAAVRASLRLPDGETRDLTLGERGFIPVPPWGIAHLTLG